MSSTTEQIQDAEVTKQLIEEGQFDKEPIPEHIADVIGAEPISVGAPQRPPVSHIGHDAVPGPALVVSKPAVIGADPVDEKVVQEDVPVEVTPVEEVAIQDVPAVQTPVTVEDATVSPTQEQDVILPVDPVAVVHPTTEIAVPADGETVGITTEGPIGSEEAVEVVDSAH